MNDREGETNNIRHTVAGAEDKIGGDVEGRVLIFCCAVMFWSLAAENPACHLSQRGVVST
jgi:hypothetical protein